MPQGASLRARHVWNVGQEWYVDAVNGNDTTGDGSSGNPWQTLQKAADYLAATATWVAAGQDVRVNIQNGTYQASPGATGTLKTAFSNAARAPASNRYLIWAAVNPGSVVIKNPNNATGACNAIEVGNNALNSYQIFSGLELDGEQAPRGTGNGCSLGVYLTGTAADSNTRIEFVDCEIHGFYPTDGVGNSSNGIFSEEGGTFVFIDRCEFYDIGKNLTGTTWDGHGIYMQGANGQATNCIFRDIWGFGGQLYNAGAVVNGWIIANNTFDNNGIGGDTNVGSGFLVHGDAQNTKIVNNVFSNHNYTQSSSAAITFQPAASGLGSGNVIDHNLSWNNWAGHYNGTLGAGWTESNWLDGDPKYITAPPQFIAKGTAAAATTSSVAPTLPTGIQADDVVYLFVMHHQPVSVGVIDTPAGWTEAAQGTYQDSVPANAGRAALFWKRMSGGESGTVTVTTTGDTGTDTLLFAQMYLIRDSVASGNPYESIAADYGPGNATIDFGAVTVSGIERTLLAFAFNAAAVTVNPITGYITKPDHDLTTAGTDGRMRLQWKRNVSSDGAVTATGGSTIGWATFHVAAQPRDPSGHAQPDLHPRDSTSALVGYTDTNYSFGYDIDGNARTAGAEDAGAYEFQPPPGPGGPDPHKRMRLKPLSLGL